MPDETLHQAGGVSPWSSEPTEASVTDFIGRLWNNLNGTTASNQAAAYQAELDRFFQSQEAEKARLFNSAEAQKNRDWEQYMSNTAFQRQVADLKAAGLNPAAVQGNGASTPSGSVVSGPAASGSRAGVANSPGMGAMIGMIASNAIGKALAAKFGNVAMKAADHHELVAAKINAMAKHEITNAQRAEALAKYNDIKARFYAKSVNSQADLNDTRAAYLSSHNYRWRKEKKGYDPDHITVADIQRRIEERRNGWR